MVWESIACVEHRLLLLLLKLPRIHRHVRIHLRLEIHGVRQQSALVYDADQLELHGLLAPVVLADVLHDLELEPDLRPVLRFLQQVLVDLRLQEVVVVHKQVLCRFIHHDKPVALHLVEELELASVQLLLLLLRVAALVD